LRCAPTLDASAVSTRSNIRVLSRTTVDFCDNFRRISEARFARTIHADRHHANRQPGAIRLPPAL
jgi:hypothetical protein